MEELKKGYKYFEEGDFEKALIIFNTHLAKDSSDLEALFKRAISFRKLDKFQDSLKDFETLTNLQPKSADLISERGISKYYCDDLIGALDDFNLCVKLEPLNPYRYSSRAYIRGQNKDIDGAIADYEKTIELDPNDVTALNNLGLLEEQKGRMGSAQDKFKKSDDLMGVKKRTPEDYNDAIAKSNSNKITNSVEPLNDTDSNEKVTTKSYFNTLTDIFTNKEVRREFFDFLFKNKKAE